MTTTSPANFALTDSNPAAQIDFANVAFTMSITSLAGL
jgi:hypothetical protein